MFKFGFLPGNVKKFLTKSHHDGGLLPYLKPELYSYSDPKRHIINKI